MAWILIVSLIAFGVLFLLIEILVMPGATIASIIGFGLLVTGIVIGFNNYGVEGGVITIGGSLAASILGIGLALKSKTWNRAMLATELDGRVNVIDKEKLNVGDSGKTITRLNPMGKALVNGEYFEVTSNDNIINENSNVVVTKIDGNKIFVKLK
jgi:membrane-bound ClpP family serine protease